MCRTVVPSLLSACALTVVVGGCAGTDEASSASTAGGTTAADASAPESGAGELTARLVDPEGGEVGVATLTEVEGGTQVEVRVTGLSPGFHGFHVHAVGRCEPDSPSPTDPAMTGDFLSAGGHLGAGEADHGEHAGDLPLLFVTEAGTGALTVVTDTLTLDQVTDEDGSAVMVHADRDNYANVPERYAPGGPDQMTRNTGDAGGRIACGPVEG
ncbi:superoxide dismutase family protein [Geodermatophilus poikilotrophus]|uniref:Superoxide dismutase [Cu-Zn] n=1 Tax=Geodermatophilus poikilotrophus TaxID=1333667 RepID=A0A1H9ZB89_9ACTN|nr:superoxide dismutase family protein [Geodermatophilus poikilotrophus]SES78820.1 superoxide dismutase, Cu-Zn family [Geodermatophilus poikilotrophus]